MLDTLTRYIHSLSCAACSAELTWRDVQHLTVLTSKRSHLHDARGRHNWTINGAGLEFNHLVRSHAPEHLA